MANDSGTAYPQSSANTDNLKRGIQNIGEHASHLKDDVVSLGNEVAGTAKAGATVAKEQVAKGIDYSKEQVNKGLEYTKEQGEKACKNVQDFVTERPMTSVVIAAGAGLFLGMLLARSRD